MNSSWITIVLLVGIILYAGTCCAAADMASADQSENPGGHLISGISGTDQADRFNTSGICSTCNDVKPGSGPASGTDWDRSGTQTGLLPTTGPGGRGSTDCRLVGDELICMVDNDPELDFYQPCDGGDNAIIFAITVSGHFRGPLFQL